MNIDNEQSDKDLQARLNAQKLWNSTPCGVVEGEALDLDYFLRVEKNRYEVTDKWMNRGIPFSAYGGKKILEIGVGQGTDLARFSRNGAVCHGIDITDEHLRRTDENFKARGLSVELKKCDAVEIAYPDNSFDLVYSMGVIHHIPEKERVLKEVRRVLKPGGIFLGAFYRKFSAFHLFQKLLGEGLRGGGLFRLGYAGLLSTIEQGADGIKVKPYVELYTDHSFAKACSKAGLQVRGMHSYHLAKAHFGPLSRFLSPSIENSHKLEQIFGWYLVGEAVKG